MLARTTMITLALSALALAGCTDNNAIASDCSDEVLLTENVNVLLETTLGNITLELFVEQVPTTTSNFAALARDGEYDGVPFHRIITNFMMQGGDYTHGSGVGGKAHAGCDPDGDGNIPDEIHPDLRHSGKGILSMAKTSAPDSGGSQFFITFAATSWLDDVHTVFGQVVDGMDVVDRVNAEAGTKSGQPRTPVTLIRATVIE